MVVAPELDDDDDIFGTWLIVKRPFMQHHLEASRL